MKAKGIAVFFVAFLLIFGLSCCVSEMEQESSENGSCESSQKDSQSTDGNETGLEKEQTENIEKQEDIKAEGNPYLSITYGRDNPENLTGREMVFYTYDINAKQLKEECVIPFESGYASGVVSKYKNVVYFQGNTVPGDYSKGNSLWVYDIATGEASILDNENHSYNDILLINEDTLLVMMVTDQHPIMPVLFDLNTKTFTYMADVNNDPFIYTSGPTSPFYNYITKQFTCIYWSDEEDSGDSGYTSFETAIDHYVALVSDDLVRDPDKVFTHRAKIDEMNMESAIQISENELLVTMRNWVESVPAEYYSLVFEDGKATFTPTECPYPDAYYICNLYTIDEGRTFYFYLYGDKKGNSPGVYSYRTDTDELTPILLNDPEIGGRYINFSLIGP